MTMMGCRLVHLKYVLNGLERTGIPLVSWDGSNYIPFSAFDDMGIYVLIPYIAHFFSLSLSYAINIFFNSIFFGSFLVSSIAFFLLYQKTFERLIIIFQLIFLFLVYKKYAYHDVYGSYIASGLFTIPLMLYLTHKNKSSIFLYFFMSFAGCILGLFHYIRSYSSLGAFTFIILSIITNREFTFKKKAILSFLLLLSLRVPFTYFKTVITNYKNFNLEKGIPIKGLSTDHMLWHTIYVGFGFLNFCNKDNIQWSDACGAQKVLQNDEKLTQMQTDKYEAILKKETFKLIVEQPTFVLYTLFAKIGILLLYFLIFTNIGFLGWLFFRSCRSIDLIFFSSLLVSAITPLLSIPSIIYSLEFVCIASLWMIVSTNIVLSCLDIKKYFRNIFRRQTVATCDITNITCKNL